MERWRRQPDNLRYWSEAHRVIGGKPMELPPAWEAIYEDTHPFVVIRKPTQVGATEYNLNLALHAAAAGYADRGIVLYVLPTGDFASRISQVRLGKAINESTALRKLTKRGDHEVVKSAANVFRRAFGDGVVYFAGVEAEAQYSGIDADVVIVDEFDLMDENALSSLRSRLRSSQAGRMVVTSTPTIEAFGISRLYEASDQRVYELECPSCGQWQAPEFPESVDWNRMAVVCLGCSAELDPWRAGRWVAHHPETSAIHGYQLNRLVLPNPPLIEMKLALENQIPTTKEDFYRHELGQPYVAEDARLTLADLEACVAPWKIDERAFQFEKCVMGVDVGKRLHVVIRGYFEGRWYLHRAFTCESFEELDPLFKQHHITACVVDAFPETRVARAFEDRHGWEVYLCLYVHSGMSPHWDHQDGVKYVRAPRTYALDQMLHNFKNQLYALPADFREICHGEYVDNLLAPVRVQELDGYGHPVAVYKNSRADHFAHAETYAALCIERGWFGGGVIQIGVGPHGFFIPDKYPHPDLRFRR